MRKRLNKSILLEKQKHGSSVADMRNFLVQNGWTKEGEKWLHPKHQGKTRFARLALGYGIVAAFSLALSHKVELHNALNKVFDTLEEDEDLKKRYIGTMSVMLFEQIMKSKNLFDPKVSSDSSALIDTTRSAASNFIESLLV